MLTVKQRKDRPIESIEPISAAIDLLKNQFGQRRIYIKNSQPRMEVQINEFMDDNTFLIITDPEFQPPSSSMIVVYGLLDKYLEFDFLVKEVRGPGYFHCECVGARKGTTGRRDVRFKMNPDDVVATNFKFSKYTLELSGFTIPTGIKVILEQFHSSHTQLGDIVKVDVFSQGDPILDVVKKTGNAVFVEDMANLESYRAQIPGMDFSDSSR